jgi:ArsR family transcriptional regulator
MDDGRLVRVLKALADGKRFRMVQEIAAAGELSCGQLAEKFTLSQPTISHHLKILLDAGVLVARHDAQHHFISVNQELLDELATLLPGRLTRTDRRSPKRERRVEKR